MSRSTAILFCLAGAWPSWGQNLITTFAGTDWVYPKGSLPAVNAPLGRLAGLAVAPNGDLLAADFDNALVLRITTAGVATVVAGTGISAYSGDGGPATRASLVHPAGVAADRSGNVYVVDYV